MQDQPTAGTNCLRVTKAGMVLKKYSTGDAAMPLVVGAVGGKSAIFDGSLTLSDSNAGILVSNVAGTVTSLKLAANRVIYANTSSLPSTDTVSNYNDQTNTLGNVALKYLGVGTGLSQINAANITIGELPRARLYQKTHCDVVTKTQTSRTCTLKFEYAGNGVGDPNPANNFTSVSFQTLMDDGSDATRLAQAGTVASAIAGAGALETIGGALTAVGGIAKLLGSLLGGGSSDVDELIDKAVVKERKANNPFTGNHDDQPSDDLKYLFTLASDHEPYRVLIGPKQGTVNRFEVDGNILGNANLAVGLATGNAANLARLYVVPSTNVNTIQVGSNVLALTPQGRLGLGTAAPGYALQLASNTSAAAGDRLMIGSDLNRAVETGWNGDGSGGFLTLYNNSNAATVQLNVASQVLTAVTASTLNVSGFYSIGLLSAGVRSYQSNMRLGDPGTSKLTFNSPGTGRGAAFSVRVMGGRPSSGQESIFHEEFDISWTGKTAQPPVITQAKRYFRTNTSNIGASPSVWWYDSVTDRITLETTRLGGITYSYSLFFIVTGYVGLEPIATADTNTPPGVALVPSIEHDGRAKTSNFSRSLIVGSSLSANITDISGPLTGTNATFTGNVTASKFLGDGSALTGITVSGSAVTGDVTLTGNLSAAGQLSLGPIGSRIRTFQVTMTGGTAGSAKLTFPIPSGAMGCTVRVAAYRSVSGTESVFHEEFDVSYSGYSGHVPSVTQAKRYFNRVATTIYPSVWYYDSSTRTITLETTRVVGSFTYGLNYTIQGLLIANPTPSFDTNTPPGVALTPAIEHDGLALRSNFAGSVLVGSNLTANVLSVSGLLSGANAGFSGNVTASRFIGDGSALTGLNISANAVVGGALQATSANFTGNVTAARFIGDGSALTNISASSVTGPLDSAPGWNGLTSNLSLKDSITNLEFGRIDLRRTNLRYPPVTLDTSSAANTSSTIITNLSDPFTGLTQAGSYTFSSSSGSVSVGYAFNGIVSDSWVSGSQTGAYSANVATTSAPLTSTTTGNVYGHWLQLRTPSDVFPSEYYIYSANTTAAATQVVLCGSNNNISWTQLGTSPILSTGLYVRVSLNNITAKYSYFRWIVNINNGSTTQAQIGEVYLKGFTNDPRVPNGSARFSKLSLSNSLYPNSVNGGLSFADASDANYAGAQIYLDSTNKLSIQGQGSSIIGLSSDGINMQPRLHIGDDAVPALDVSSGVAFSVNGLSSFGAIKSYGTLETNGFFNTKNDAIFDGQATFNNKITATAANSFVETMNIAGTATFNTGVFSYASAQKLQVNALAITSNLTPNPSLNTRFQFAYTPGTNTANNILQQFIRIKEMKIRNVTNMGGTQLNMFSAGYSGTSGFNGSISVITTNSSLLSYTLDGRVALGQGRNLNVLNPPSPVSYPCYRLYELCEEGMTEDTQFLIVTVYHSGSLQIWLNGSLIYTNASSVSFPGRNFIIPSAPFYCWKMLAYSATNDHVLWLKWDFPSEVP